MDIYDELLKRGDDNSTIHVFKATCLYALAMYKEAKAEAEQATDENPLKMRLLFQLAQKLGDENDIMNLHGRLTSSIED